MALSDRWFEGLTRTLAVPRSRRGILGGIAAGSVVALIPAVAQAGTDPATPGVCKKSGETSCCVNTSNDAGNCGACGNACPPGQVCTSGVCGCPPGLTQCGSLCISVGSDNLNCGSCGNVCPPGSACMGGRCQSCLCGSVVCTASDQCHVPGVCNPTTGQCSNPAAPDGTPCSTGNACVRGATCQNGVCTGTTVVCTASDQCHVAGTCDPTTGTCSNPPAPNGTPCDTGNKCILSATCQSGVCVGANPVVCAASDQCHIAGVCDPVTGTCSNPAVPDGTPCTTTSGLSSTCQGGVCAACGALGQSCCTGDECSAGVCSGCGGLFTPRVCTQCGEAGQPCCQEIGLGSLCVYTCSTPFTCNGNLICQ